LHSNPRKKTVESARKNKKEKLWRDQNPKQQQQTVIGRLIESNAESKAWICHSLAADFWASTTSEWPSASRSMPRICCWRRLEALRPVPWPPAVSSAICHWVSHFPLRAWVGPRGVFGVEPTPVGMKSWTSIKLFVQNH